MSRLRFNLIVAIMSFALAGLIFLQAYWIRHDVLIKQHQFDESVKQALMEVIDKVEQDENMRIVAGNFLSETDTSWVEQQWMDTTISSLIDLYVPQPPEPPTPMPEVPNEVHERLEGFLRKYKNAGYRDLSKSQTLVAVDSIINIKIEKDVQQKEVFAIRMQPYGNNRDEFTEVTEKRVKTKLRKLSNLMQRFTFQVFDQEQNPLKRIHPKELDSIINHVLINRGLPCEYNFGIGKIEHDSLVYIKNPKEKQDLMNTKYFANLFPNDVFNHNDQLLLGMNGKISYILISIWPMLLSSLLFSLIIILGFAYTLFTILKQKRLADVKNDFINNMTHEFKTPIATISIANQAIRDPRIHNNEEKLKYYNDVISDENERMLKHVEHVLQMAQIDKGELKLRKEHIDMHDVIHRAINKVMLQVEHRGGKINALLNANYCVVYGDGNHLLNAVINLLDNANKYTFETPVITITTQNEENKIIISVNDNGIGISKESQKKIFETFYRVQTGNIHDVKGFGLGLSYVKAIVESHYGEISVISDLAKGSNFVIALPLIN